MNRNPFADPNLMTVDAMITAIEADSTLARQRRRDLCSSLRTLAKLVGKTPQEMPGHIRYLRPFINNLNPAQAGVSRKRLQNLRSDIMFALRHLGIATGWSSYLAPLRPDWGTLYGRIEETRLKANLGRFIRYCSHHDIAPGAVTDEISAAFLGALIDESLVRKPEQLHRLACKMWNRAALEVTGWPRVTLSVPSYRKPYAVAWDRFPSSFAEEVDRWIAWLSGNDLFADNAIRRPLRPASLHTRRLQVQLLASALVHRGTDPGTITSLAKIVEPEALKEALRFHLERSKSELTTHIQGLAYVAKAIARHWVKADDKTLEAIDAIYQRLRPERRGLAEKNIKRLRQFDDERNIGLLLMFPQTQLNEARARDTGGKTTAVTVQLAVAVEILLNCPIRLGNLANLSIERHLVWSRHRGRRTVHLAIPPEEVKNRVAIECELSDDAVELLEVYIRDYRPRLLADGPCEWLFPGRGSAPKVTGALYIQITGRIAKATGLDVNPHLFRHIAAKLHLDAHPGEYEVVRRLLGHRSYETVARYYTGLEARAAFQHYHRGLAERRTRHTPDARL